jgi:hypothetical protein
LLFTGVSKFKNNINHLCKQTLNISQTKCLGLLLNFRVIFKHIYNN